MARWPRQAHRSSQASVCKAQPSLLTHPLPSGVDKHTPKDHSWGVWEPTEAASPCLAGAVAATVAKTRNLQVGRHPRGHSSLRCRKPRSLRISSCKGLGSARSRHSWVKHCPCLHCTAVLPRIYSFWVCRAATLQAIANLHLLGIYCEPGTV